VHDYSPTWEKRGWPFVGAKRVVQRSPIPPYTVAGGRFGGGPIEVNFGQPGTGSRTRGRRRRPPDQCSRRACRFLRLTARRSGFAPWRPGRPLVAYIEDLIGRSRCAARPTDRQPTSFRRRQYPGWPKGPACRRWERGRARRMLGARQLAALRTTAPTRGSKEFRRGRGSEHVGARSSHDLRPDGTVKLGRKLAGMSRSRCSDADPPLRDPAIVNPPGILPLLLDVQAVRPDGRGCLRAPRASGADCVGDDRRRDHPRSGSGSRGTVPVPLRPDGGHSGGWARPGREGADRRTSRGG